MYYIIYFPHIPYFYYSHAFSFSCPHKIINLLSSPSLPIAPAILRYVQLRRRSKRRGGVCLFVPIAFRVQNFHNILKQQVRTSRLIVYAGFHFNRSNVNAWFLAKCRPLIKPRTGIVYKVIIESAMSQSKDKKHKIPGFCGHRLPVGTVLWLKNVFPLASYSQHTSSDRPH